MKKIYFDYAASTPMDPVVREAMEPYFMERFGNPGSLHSFGQEAIAAVDRSRETIAKALGAHFRQVLFAGSATEANVLALRGTLLKFSRSMPRLAKPRIVVSAIEHESVIETARAIGQMGAELVVIPVGRRGIIDEKKIKESLTPDTVLVSIMSANNEIGAIEPVAETAKIVKDFRGSHVYPLFHTDAVQTFQFFECDVEELSVDLMTISAHKIYGPKGAGALYAREPGLLAPITTGGGQEFGLRSGTENVPAIVGFAKAVELLGKMRKNDAKRIAALRDRLWEGIKAACPEAEENGGEGGERLPNILNVYFPGREAQDLLVKLDMKGLAASSGSACRARAIEPSHVIEALGYDKARARQSVRFSLGRPTTEGEIKEAIAIIKSVL